MGGWGWGGGCEFGPQVWLVIEDREVAAFGEAQMGVAQNVPREGQTAGLGPCFHLTGQAILVPFF